MYRRYSPKKRCFLIFNEECKTVNCLPTLGVAFKVLQQSLFGVSLHQYTSSQLLTGDLAVQLMFLAGWVHHDLSPGNILGFSADGELTWASKLADLEYATKFPLTGAKSSLDRKMVRVKNCISLAFPFTHVDSREHRTSCPARFSMV